MRIVFMGTPSFAAVILRRLLETEHDVVGVFCQPDRPAGRSHCPVPPPTKLCCLPGSVPVFQPKGLRRRGFEILKQLGLIEHVAGLLKPLLMIMGLDQSVGVLWLLAAVFGLGFGGVAIMQQSREADLEINEIRKLHISIGINHAMIDEPVMFLSVGVNPFWLWIPRLIAAIASVWLYLAWLKLKSHMCMDNAGLNK